MQWPTIEALSAMVPLPDGYRYEMLARPVIPALIDSVRLWHPDIAVGGGSCYLQEDFYISAVALAGDANKDDFVGVFRRDDEFVGMWSWERVPDTLSLYGRLIIVAPAHREAKLASKVMPLAELAGRAMGAEFLFGLATLKIPHMQRALESAGLPANEGHQVSHETICRSPFIQARGALKRELLEHLRGTRGMRRSRPQYMPKGIGISDYSQLQLNAIARQLNQRPRKTLGFRTPAEMFSERVALTS